jgi:hypothetical protein
VTRALRALLLAALALSVSCTSTSRPKTVPVLGEYADAARGAYERARQHAYGPRRFKALFQGEIAQTIGGIARGYLSCWWDGRVLVWRTSAPLAGAGNEGRLALDAPSAGRVPFPGELDGRDAIGVLLGVLDLPPAGPVESWRDGFRVALDGHGRVALLDEKLRIVGFELPGAKVAYEPGEAIPRRIDAKTREGSADLKLQSFGDWPASEPIP